MSENHSTLSSYILKFILMAYIIVFSTVFFHIPLLTYIHCIFTLLILHPITYINDYSKLLYVYIVLHESAELLFNYYKYYWRRVCQECYFLNSLYVLKDCFSKSFLIFECILKIARLQNNRYFSVSMTVSSAFEDFLSLWWEDFVTMFSIVYRS